MRFTSRAALLTATLGLVALVGLAPTLASAQDTPAPAPAPTATGEAQPAGTQAPAPAGTDTAAPAASSAPAVTPATGYGWSTTPPRHLPRPRSPGRTARGSQAPDAILPGFETLADGSTRLFVQLTKPVKYEVKPARGVLTYVLKGAYADKRNNFNPLVTVHFNTPVTNARLVPHGRDLWFVVDLRANVTPTVAMDSTKDGGAMLRIEFPKGDYLPGQASAPAPPADTTPSPAGPAASH